MIFNLSHLKYILLTLILLLYRSQATGQTKTCSPPKNISCSPNELWIQILNTELYESKMHIFSIQTYKLLTKRLNCLGHQPQARQSRSQQRPWVEPEYYIKLENSRLLFLKNKNFFILFLYFLYLKKTVPCLISLA